ncbi:hypothetical protein MIZ03_2236 [Rhodoferax lithotrophicus]|uniref:Uncharacterized protein n=1 Tax=Rhodoferax lithotrophicus TaxID=2798804 RepID=A0ABM7MM24_9BURK|nr:hypothetical protein MIZ03_2236 [Rhodoferax sp. MIZ03]
MFSSYTWKTHNQTTFDLQGIIFSWVVIFAKNAHELSHF